MAIYSQIASLPIIFQLGSNIIPNVEEIISSKNLLFHKILIVSGSSISLAVSKKVELKGIVGREIVLNNSYSEANRISKIVSENNIDLIIGIGGGKVLDVVKRAALLQKINHISIPTIISNDGLISPVSVLLNEDNRTESIAGLMPIGVIIDIDLIMNSPLIYIQAAAGDILSNMSATNDWLFSYKISNEKINDISFQLSRMSAHSSIYFNHIDLKSKDFIKMIIQGQLNSGIAMGLSGNSRPCSGGEHLLSHAIDYLQMDKSKLHGYQVGVLSLFCLYLQDELDLKVINYARQIGIPSDIESICKDLENNFAELIRVSRKMRPGRMTILDKYSDNEIIEKYKSYSDFSI